MSQEIVLVTGATSGIGRHAALYLAARHHGRSADRARYRVIATGRRRTVLAQLAAEATERGLTLDTIELDVTSAESIAAARAEVDRLTDGYGIDVLVNNAGYGQAGPASEITDRELRDQYDTNVFGLMAVTRAFVPAMRARGRGRVINISSVGGRMTLPLYGVYNSTKYAVESLSDALRYELRPFGIHVVVIEPGVIATNFGPRSMSLVARHHDSASPYAGAVANLERLTERSDRFAVGPACISRAIDRAIRRRSPAARYIAPFRTRIVLALYQLLPTRLSDAVIRRAVGLHRTRLPAPVSAPQLSSSR